jgi:hypothetical protein
MVRDTKSPYDDYTARCAMLGHLVPFTYCMSPGSDLPCRKILDCWHERIDIADFLNKNLSPEEIECITAPPKPKVMQLLDLVQKAKVRS